MGLGPGAGGSVTPGTGSGMRGPAGSSPRGGNRRQKAEELIDMIIESIEPMAWDQNGGSWATIRYYEGSLIVRAPDYIHRQIGGYPRPLRPRPERPTVPAAPATTNPGG